MNDPLRFTRVSIADSLGVVLLILPIREDKSVQSPHLVKGGSPEPTGGGPGPFRHRFQGTGLRSLAG